MVVVELDGKLHWLYFKIVNYGGCVSGCFTTLKQLLSLSLTCISSVTNNFVS